MRLTPFIFIIIIGALTFTGLSVCIQEGLMPKSVAPVTEIKIGLYPGMTTTERYNMYTHQARKFEITIKNCSEELQIATVSGKPIEAPCNLQPITWSPKRQYAEWGFRITAPETIQPGTYEINIVIKISKWFTSEEHPLKFVVIVEPLK